MKQIKITALIISLGLILPAFAQNPTIYVIDKAGKRINGSKIEQIKDTQFKLTLPGTGGASRTFRKGSYVKVVTPAPKGYAALEKAYKSKNWSTVISNGPKLLSGNELLGWGGRISYYIGAAQYYTGKFKEAKATFEKGYMLAFQEGHGLEIRHVGMYLASARKLGENTDAFLEKLPESPSFAPFKNVLAGNKFQQQGKIEDAVLSYMRVITLPRSEVGDARRDALEGIVKTLESKGDNRAKEFKAILNSEYK